MRKDTLIMIVAMVVITMGVYYGLETFVRSHEGSGHGATTVASNEEEAVAEVIEEDAEIVAEAPTAPAPEPASSDEMELVEAPAEESMPDMAMQEEAEPEAEAEEVAAEPEPESMAEATDEMGDSGDKSEELTEIAVRAAVEEAVKAAAIAAEQAVREAMQARSEQ